MITATNFLIGEGINVRVIDMHTIKPLDKEIILKSARETKHIFTVEDHSVIGGLGSAVCDVIATASFEELGSKHINVTKMGINDEFGMSGKWNELLAHYKLDAEGIKERIRSNV